MSETYQEVVNGRRVLCGRCRWDLQQSRVVGGALDSATGLTFQCDNCHATYAVCIVCGWYMADGKTCNLPHAEFNDAAASQATAEGDTTMAVQLPDSVDQSKLARDPAGRPGRWFDAASNTTFNLGPDFRPAAKAAQLAPSLGSTFDDAAMHLRAKTREELVAYALGNYSIRITDSRANKDSIIASIVQSAGYPVPIATAAYERVPEDAGEPDPQDNTGKRIAITMGRFVGRKGMVSEVGEEGENYDVRAVLDGDGTEIPLTIDMFRYLTVDEVAADEAALLAANGDASKANIPPAAAQQPVAQQSSIPAAQDQQASGEQPAGIGTQGEAAVDAVSAAADQGQQQAEG
jgi:hypothetical protein